MRIWFAVLTLALAFVSCAPPASHPDNAKALRDIADRSSGVEETVEGNVVGILPNSHGPSGTHERFIVDVRSDNSSISLYVTDNISVGQAAPLHVGDHVVVKGALAFNDRGPLLHWTHRDPSMRHAPGFVQVRGRMYE